MLFFVCDLFNDNDNNKDQKEKQYTHSQLIISIFFLVVLYYQ